MRKSFLSLLLAFACLLIVESSLSILLASDKDIVYPNKRGKVVFSHKYHRALKKVTCASCHPKIFKMKVGVNNIKMADLYKGKFCALCHTGKPNQGFAIKNCNRCHQVKT